MYNYKKLLKKHNFYDIETLEVRGLKTGNKILTHESDVYLFGKQIKVSAHLILAKL